MINFILVFPLILITWIMLLFYCRRIINRNLEQFKFLLDIVHNEGLNSTIFADQLIIVCNGIIKQYKFLLFFVNMPKDLKIILSALIYYSMYLLFR